MIELLAPAGDLEKLKIAILYGADAVFLGGTDFSLRARASNFDIKDIKDATTFAHERSKKVYVTTNIIPHHEDLQGLITYLKALESAQVDAIICASPYIIEMALEHTSLEVHLSTQQSALNANTVNYWHQKGVKRVVLARELDKHMIKDLKHQTKADIEVFIHGGMCMSYSGRCSLSNTMTNRDANRGGCAHSCRWEYTLLKNNLPIDDTLFSMSSKDLAAIEQIPNLIDAGVASLKIEGRMKSLHYIATVVSTYRKLIDDYISHGNISDFKPYHEQLMKAENRLASHGYLEGMPSIDEQLFKHRSEKPNQLFIGLVLSTDPIQHLSKIEQRNHFKLGDEVELFMPNGKVIPFVIETLLDETHQPILVARHPKEILIINMPVDAPAYALLRKRL